MLRRFSLVICCFLILSGCKKNKQEETQDTDEGSYFSIRMFARDQFSVFGEQPFTLEKIVVLNGQRDSSMVHATDVDWAGVLRIFFEADISDKKFLDRYSFSVLEDDVTDTRTYLYEAKEEDLFTRSLQINADPVNNKIKSIYIETRKKDFWGSKQQKLFYIPIELIQIQEFQSPLIGSDRNLRIEYRFL